MKQYLGIFAGMAVLIMVLPCFAFVGADKPLSPQESSLPNTSSKTQTVTADTETFRIFNHKTQKVETLAASD